MINFLTQLRLVGIASRASVLGAWILCLCGSAIATEFTLQIPREVRVIPGEELSVPLSVAGAGAARVSYSVFNAPAGASIERLDDGSALFLWSNTDKLAEQTIVIISAAADDSRLAKSSARLSIVPIFQVGGGLVARNRATDRANRLPIFPGLPAQSLSVGANYQLWMRSKDPDTGSAPIQARSLPIGASLSGQPNGGFIFEWTPIEKQIGSHTIVFSATDTSNNALQVQRRIEFFIHAAESLPTDELSPLAAITENSSEPQQNSGVRPPIPAASILASSSMSVSSIGIEPLSTQIIGVGQVVTFPVIPIVGEGTEAVLQVDRLPRGATFDVNPLGVRVFRWETNEGDEGEHVFRISVLDKDRPGNRAHKDVSVIVGNPTVNSTLPTPLSGGQAPMLDVPEMLSVRVGQSVQFRIASANPGGSPPTISMSQFPIGATLHANPDGSQQFHWQPQSAQVGEHIVSFMAQHTGTANLESYSDVVLHVAP